MQIYDDDIESDFERMKRSFSKIIEESDNNSIFKTCDKLNKQRQVAALTWDKFINL